ncbi:hypothetical protein EZS27_042585, partial [termite gut metagenome]
SILLISLFLPACVSLQAQNTQPETENEKEKIPLYNGVYVGADLYGVGNNLFGSDFFTAEVSVDVSLKRRFFPVLEMGYGKTDVWGEWGMRYKVAAPYFRIGMNYNGAYKKNRESHWYVGLRYGLSNFSYDVEQLSIKDPLWNETVGNNPALKDGIWRENGLPYEHPGLKAGVQWYELVFGVRVQVYKNFMMGWSVRSKTALSSS